MRVHVCVRKRVRLFVCTYVRSLQAYVRAFVRARIHACARPFVVACVGLRVCVKLEKFK